MKQNIIAILTIGAVTAVLHGHARADVVLSGPDSNDGSYSTAASAGHRDGRRYRELGRDTPGSRLGPAGRFDDRDVGHQSAMAPTRPPMAASTPTRPPASTARTRSCAITSWEFRRSGQQSVVSLGEIDPFFGGTSATPAFIAYQSTGGGLLDEPDAHRAGSAGANPRQSHRPGACCRFRPCRTQAKASLSTAVTLSGNVANPGSYSLAKLQNNFTAAQATAGGDTLYRLAAVDLSEPVLQQPNEPDRRRTGHRRLRGCGGSGRVGPDRWRQSQRSAGLRRYRNRVSRRWGRPTDIPRRQPRGTVCFQSRRHDR